MLNEDRSLELKRYGLYDFILDFINNPGLISITLDELKEIMVGPLKAYYYGSPEEFKLNIINNDKYNNGLMLLNASISMKLDYIEKIYREFLKDVKNNKRIGVTYQDDDSSKVLILYY